MLTCSIFFFSLHIYTYNIVLTLGIQINIFKQKRLLNNIPYYLNDDYPKQILEKRRQLNNQVIQER